MDQVVCTFEDRSRLLDLLKDHVTGNIVKVRALHLIHNDIF